MYNELMLLYQAASKIVPENADNWRVLSRKTKSRFIEIYKCLKAGTPVPSMPLTNSVIRPGSSSFAPSNMGNSNFPAAPSNPIFSSAPTNPSFPAAPTNPNFPAAPTNPNFPAAPSNPIFSSAPSNPSFPSAPSNSNFPSAPSNPSFPATPTNPSFPTAPSNPNFPTAPSNPNFPAAPTNPNFPAAPSSPSFPQNNLGSPSFPTAPSNPNFPVSAPSFQMGNQDRFNGGYTGFAEPSNYYNVAHSAIPMHPEEPQPGLRRSCSSNCDSSAERTQFDDVPLPGDSRDTWGNQGNFPLNGGRPMGMQSDFSSGGNPMGNFGGNRMPSYGENKQQQFGMGGNGQSAPSMNFIQDFGGQTTIIQSGLKNRQTGVGTERWVEE